MKRPAEIRNVTVDPQDFIAGVVFGIVSIIASYVWCFWPEFKGANLIFLFSWLILLSSLRRYVISLGAPAAGIWLRRFMILVGIEVTIELFARPFADLAIWRHIIVINILKVIKLGYLLYLLYVVVQAAREFHKLSVITSLFTNLTKAVYTAIFLGVLFGFLLPFEVINATVKNIPSVFMILILYRAYRFNLRQ